MISGVGILRVRVTATGNPSGTSAQEHGGSNAASTTASGSLPDHARAPGGCRWAPVEGLEVGVQSSGVGADADEAWGAPQGGG